MFGRDMWKRVFLLFFFFFFFFIYAHSDGLDQ